jgi:hypothetical protein
MEDETNETCDTYGREQQCTKDFGWKTWYIDTDWNTQACIETSYLNNLKVMALEFIDSMQLA